MTLNDQITIIKDWIKSKDFVLINDSLSSVEFKKSLYDRWYYEIEKIEENYILSVFKEDERHIPFDLGSFDLNVSVKDENDLKDFLNQVQDYILEYPEVDDSVILIDLIRFQGSKHKIHIHGNPISFHTFFVYTKFERFLKDYVDLLKTIDYDEYFWEHPKLIADSLMDEYEVSIVESKRLNFVKPNSNPFSQYFKGDDSVVTFSNRGGNAILIVPEPDKNSNDFSTISRFVNNAETSLSIEFFKTVFGEWYRNFKGNTNYLYLSTHGLGVHWLHVRIDEYPKYYHTEIYKSS